jgi:hypothetical protein
MTQPAGRDDVLGEFAVEPVHDRKTIELYLKRYPQFANELLDLVAELGRSYSSSTEELSATNLARIESSWQIYSATPAQSVLSSLSVERLREIAKALRIPRQVISAFRESRVILSTVPKGFLERLAELAGSTVDGLREHGAMPARSYKSDVKPEAGEGIAFEQLLIDAGLSEEQRRDLMSDHD